MATPGNGLFDMARAAAKRALGVVDEETQAAEAERRAQAESRMRAQIDLLSGFQAQREQAPPQTGFEAYQQNPQLAIAERAAEQAGNIPVLGSVSRAAAASADPTVSPQKKVTEALGAAGDIGLTVGAPAIGGSLVNAARTGGVMGLLRQGGMLGASVVGGEVANQGVQAGARALGAGDDTAELLGTVADFTVEPMSIIGAVRSAARRNVPGLDIPSVLKAAAGDGEGGLPPEAPEGLTNAIDGERVAVSPKTEAAKTLAAASTDARQWRGLEHAIQRADTDDASKETMMRWSQAARELVGDRVVPHAEDVAASLAIPQEALDKIKPGDKLDRPTLYRAAGRVNDIATEAMRLETQIGDLPPDEAAAALRKIEAYDKEGVRLLSSLNPTTSEAGRNLSFMRTVLRRMDPDKLATGVVQMARNRRPGRFLDPKDELEIRKAAAEMADAKTPEQQEAVRRNIAKAAATQRLGVGESLLQLRKTGFLTGPLTHIVNLSGNAAFAGGEMLAQNASALAELALAKPMAALGRDGKRLGAFTDKRILDEWKKGFAEGSRESKDILTHGASAEDLARYDMTTEVRTSLGPVSPYADKYINFVHRLLGAGDRPFRVAAYRKGLATTATVEAREAGLKGKAREKFIDDFMANPPEWADIQAIADSQFAVFSNDNSITRGISHLRNKTLSDSPTGRLAVQAVADSVIPFPKTPVNVTARALDYKTDLPLALRLMDNARALNLDPVKRKALADAIGRRGVGVAATMLGYWAYQQTADSLENEPYVTGPRGMGNSAERNVEDAADQPGGAVRIGNTWLKVDRAEPVGGLVSLGAYMAEQDAIRMGRQGVAEKTVPTGTVPSYLRAQVRGLSSVTQLPMFTGVQGIGRTMDQLARGADTGEAEQRDERAGQVVADIVGDQVASTIPSWMSSIARASDPMRRDTYLPEENTLMFNGVPVVNLSAAMERLPGVRENLPPMTESQGNPIRTTPWEAVLPVQSSDAGPSIKAQAALQSYYNPPQRRDDESDFEYAVRKSATQRLISDKVADLLERGSVTVGGKQINLAAGANDREVREAIAAVVEKTRTSLRGYVPDMNTGELVKPRKRVAR